MQLVIFDVDGTLVDSQGDIIAAMAFAFRAVDRAAPSREEVLSIVGLSLPNAMARLAPDLTAKAHAAMTESYKDAYVSLRQSADVSVTSPLYPGALDCLRQLHAQPETLLAIATGKSRKGLDILLDGHKLREFFVTTEVSDHHPSKPHPAMVEACLDATGLSAERAVMVGDTSFDMEMGRNAGVRTIGVTWGYHNRAELEADAFADSYDQVPALIDHLIGE